MGCEQGSGSVRRIRHCRRATGAAGVARGALPRCRGAADAAPRHSLARRAPLGPMRKTPGGRGQSPRSGRARSLHAGRGTAENARRGKNQLARRLPPEFIRRILGDFNRGALDATSAASALGVSRARLYQLRSGFLRNRHGYQPKTSGGDQRGRWPCAVHGFLEEFLPLQKPPISAPVLPPSCSTCTFRCAPPAGSIPTTPSNSTENGNCSGSRPERARYLREVWGNGGATHGAGITKC